MHGGTPPGRSRRAPSRDTMTSPWSVNLIALPTRLMQHLPQPRRIARAADRGTSRCTSQRQRRALFACAGVHERQHGRSRRHRVAGRPDGLELELPGLDLGEIEDVVDDRRAATRPTLRSVSSVLALLGGQLGVEQQLGHADDAVHRRPDLVAHVRQELALGRVGLLGCLTRDPKASRVEPRG